LKKLGPDFNSINQ